MMLRAFVAASVGVATGIFGITAARGLTGSWLAATVFAVVAVAFVGLWVLRRRNLALDPAASPRWLTIVSAVAMLAALVVLGRLAVFMIDPSRVAYSSVPTSTWEAAHSCLSAYYVAGQASSSTPDVYDNSLYSMPDADPTKQRTARRIGAFGVDVYEYPPQFLLLPRALHFLTPDFFSLRMLWFGLSGGVLLIGLWVVARFLGPADGTRALLLAPLVLFSMPILSVLQKGNVQVIAIAASMIAMVLFERRRFAAGGAILAFMTVGKIYPGLLLVYLLARRQWRAVAWTAGFAIAFSVATFLMLGWGSYAAFVHHLPGLVSGEAFPAFRRPASAAVNYSIPGLVFKLKLFGVPGMSFGAMKIVGWAYTIVATLLTALAGRRAWRDEEKPLVWMAILILATLRSPFLPQAYAAITSLWLLTLLAATRASSMRTPFVILLTWAALNVYWPTDWPIDPRWLAVLTAVPQAVTVLLMVLALRGTREVPDDGARLSVVRTATAAAR